MKKKILIILSIILLAGVLFNFIGLFKGENEVKSKVLFTDNSEVITSNISSIGYQKLKAEVLQGEFKGEEIDVSNLLNGQVEYDQIYEKGDYLTVALKIENGMIFDARAIDYYRQGWLLFLFIIFIIAVLLYADIIGFKALISFVLSLFIIWNVLLKGLLKGYSPIYLTSITIILLSAIIIFLVAGFTKRALAAFLSTNFGLLVTLIATYFFGYNLKLTGLTQPYGQLLIISGNSHLNLREIFYAAIILGASGAAMDIAVDIAASMHEIKEKSENISLKELIQSGFNVGRQVIGTMTTTLLLAYSGSYLTLLMLFISKETSLVRILNLKIVSSEIMRILVGSLGLVIVAPVTAVIAGVLFSYSKKTNHKNENFIEIEEEIN